MSIPLYDAARYGNGAFNISCLSGVDNFRFLSFRFLRVKQLGADKGGNPQLLVVRPPDFSRADELFELIYSFRLAYLPVFERGKNGVNLFF